MKLYRLVKCSSLALTSLKATQQLGWRRSVGDNITITNGITTDEVDGALSQVARLQEGRAQVIGDVVEAEP